MAPQGWVVLGDAMTGTSTTVNRIVKSKVITAFIGVYRLSDCSWCSLHSLYNTESISLFLSSSASGRSVWAEDGARREDREGTAVGGCAGLRDLPAGAGRPLLSHGGHRGLDWADGLPGRGNFLLDRRQSPHLHQLQVGTTKQREQQPALCLGEVRLMID